MVLSDWLQVKTTDRVLVPRPDLLYYTPRWFDVYKVLRLDS